MRDGLHADCTHAPVEVELLDDAAAFVVVFRLGVREACANQDKVPLLPVASAQWVERIAATALLDQVPLQLHHFGLLSRFDHALARQLDLD